MKTTFLLTIIAVLALIGATPLYAADDPAQDGPVTVLVTYSVLPGKEADFKNTLSRAWEFYRTNNFVLAEPHILVQDLDQDKKPRFVEIFSWASRSIHEKPPDKIWTVWQEVRTLCEPRNGHSAIHAGKVALLTPLAR